MLRAQKLSAWRRTLVAGPALAGVYLASEFGLFSDSESYCNEECQSEISHNEGFPFMDAASCTFPWSQISPPSSRPCIVRMENPLMSTLASLCTKRGTSNPSGLQKSQKAASQQARHAQAQAREPSSDESHSESGPESPDNSQANFEARLHDQIEKAELANETESREPKHVFEKAADLAETYREDMEAIKRSLDKLEVELPQNRFTENNAEIWRFAYTMGLAYAKSPSEREEVVGGTVTRIKDAVDWLRNRQFVSEAVLQAFSSNICKYGNFKPEKKICEEVYDLQLYWLKESSEGYPVLVIEMGKASRDYTKRELLVFAEAIITQVEKAVHERFSDRKGCPEQMIVVTKCKGASALKAKSLVTIIKQVSLVLNRHYPGRLHKFFVVDLPSMMKWPVKAIVSLGHPSTRQKIGLCASDDPELLRAIPQ